MAEGKRECGEMFQKNDEFAGICPLLTEEGISNVLLAKRGRRRNAGQRNRLPQLPYGHGVVGTVVVARDGVEVW